MIFCPKCGSILTPRKDKDKKVMACSCGYVDKSKDTKTLKEIVPPERKIDIIGNDEDKILPLTDAECPKCKNTQAGYWLVQTRAGDEAETKFYKCTKCKTIWREYD